MLRSGESVGRQWRQVNRLASDGNATSDQTRGLQQNPVASTNGRLRKQFGREPMFPFRIYQTPPWYLATPNPSTSWLDFCVRGGLYLGTPATGTDGETFGYDETFPVTTGLGTGVITATSGVSQFWFWVTSAGAVGSGVTFPTSGVTQIGYVDTTNTTAKVPHIRQIQYGDIVSGPGSGAVWI